jgi:DivIVA domain-containing protein
MSPLQPADLIQKDFTRAAIGYDPDEVRAFLANVASSLEELDAPPDPTRHIETYVAAILGEARSAARETIDEALDEAAEIKRETVAALEDLEWIAKAEASHARSEAYTRAEEIDRTCDADAEAEASLPANGNEGLERRLSDLHAAVRKARRLSGELQKLHTVASSLRKILDTSWAQSDAPIRVIIVCTWNRFRSPIAAEILKRMAAELGCEELVVSSRGTKARLGHAAPSEVVKCAGRLGIDITGHRSKRLARADVILADLVVVMEKWHADMVRELYPLANVVLLGHLRDASVDSADLARDGFGVFGHHWAMPDGHEINEPVGRFNRRSYERCVEEMAPHLHVLAEIIAAVPRGMSGSGHRHFAFEEVARWKGADYAAHS